MIPWSSCLALPAVRRTRIAAVITVSGARVEQTRVHRGEFYPPERTLPAPGTVDASMNSRPTIASG